MSYQAKETSGQAGNPVELYQFTLAPAGIGGGLSFPTPPPAPGNLVVGNALLAGGWSTVMFGDVAPLTTSYPPDLFHSFVGAGPSGDQEVWAAYHGSIVGIGQLYRHGVFGVPDGLLPNTHYVVRAAEWSFFAFPPRGLRIALPYGDGNSYTFDPGAGTAVPQPFGWLDRAATTDGAGLLTIDFGHYDIIPGYANVMGLGALMIFDATGTPVGGGQPGGSGSGAFFLSTTLNYTSADVPITYGGVTYLPALIERQSFRARQDGLSQAELEIALDLNNPIAQQWFVSGHLPSAPVACRILRVHADDLTDDAVPFVGQVIRTKIVDKRVVLTMASVERLAERRVPRVFNQRLCNNFLYDKVCALDPTKFQFSGVVTAILSGGFTVVVAGADTFAGADLSYFKDGVLIAPDGTRGWITGQAAGAINLQEPVPGLAVGNTVTLLAGCDLTYHTCVARFQNAHHRRAMDLIPDRNAFTGAGLL